MLFKEIEKIVDIFMTYVEDVRKNGMRKQKRARTRSSGLSN